MTDAVRSLTTLLELQADDTPSFAIGRVLDSFLSKSVSFSLLAGSLRGISRSLCSNNGSYRSCLSSIFHRINGNGIDGAKNVTISEVISFIAYDQDPLYLGNRGRVQGGWPWFQLFLLLGIISSGWLFTFVLTFTAEFLKEFGAQMIAAGNPLALETIQRLERRTSTSAVDIKEGHKSFLKLCPQGKFQLEHVMAIFRAIFPSGDPTALAPLFFRAIDVKRSGSVDFEDYWIGMEILSCGSDSDLIDWSFPGFDVDGDGLLSRSDWLTANAAILKAADGSPEAAVKHQEKLSSCAETFTSWDRSGKGALTRQEVKEEALHSQTLILDLAQARRQLMGAIRKQQGS